jgi:hypothetical protein
MGTPQKTQPTCLETSEVTTNVSLFIIKRRTLLSSRINQKNTGAHVKSWTYRFHHRKPNQPSYAEFAYVTVCTKCIIDKYIYVVVY